MAYTTIDDPSAYFQTALWSGDDATTQNITNDGNSDLQPDWVWVKCRNTAGNGFDHTVWDTSRGVDNNVNKSLSPSQTDSEGLGDNVTTTAQLGGVSAMLSDGFTVREGSVDNDSRYVNENSRTYVAWQWKANGGTTSSNSDGSITSTVQASTTSGFSIVTYTGNGSDNATVGHGLGVKPKVIIPKRRDSTSHWLINNWVSEQDYAQKLKWNDTEAQTSSDSFVKDAGSSTFTLGTDVDVNASSGTYIAYCFAEKQGFSKFGQYTGNGSTNGPFLYTGFTPNFFFVKRWDGIASWHLYDGEREKFNDGSRPTFKINTDEAEFSKNVDFLSNGIKFRDTTSDANTAGGAYIWGAFARHPFVSSKGVPTTAR